MKSWSILIYHRRNGKSVGIRIHEIGVITSIALFGMILGMFTYLGISSYKNRALLSRIIKLKAERTILMGKLNNLKNDIAKLEASADSITKCSNLIAFLAERSIPNRYVLMMGTGGIPASSPFSNKALGKRVINIQEKIDKLDKLAGFEKEELNKSIKVLNEKDNLLKHSPSIWPTLGRVTAGYGMRIHPILKKKEFHRGIDIANLRGTPIYATAYGKIRSAGWKGGYGNSVLIDHGYGYSTMYGHLRSIVVRRGQYVRRGQIIGYMGSSGLSTGPHLHYEVRFLGKQINPISYLDHSPLTY